MATKKPTDVVATILQSIQRDIAGIRKEMVRREDFDRLAQDVRRLGDDMKEIGDDVKTLVGRSGSLESRVKRLEEHTHLEP